MAKRVLIAGASGLVGSRLSEFLTSQGYEVLTLVRRTAKNSNQIEWDPVAQRIDATNLKDIFAVINLSGASIAKGRWTKSRKEELWQSRIPLTKFLVDSVSSIPSPPKVFISVSGVGVYRNSGDRILTESSATGSGFLAELAMAWEGEALKASSFAKVIVLRIGTVISKDGGALKAMLPPFRFGVGGRLASGKQYMSWIHIEDLIRLFQFAIENEALSGTINAVSPEPVTNAEFSKKLAKTLHRPAIFPVPKFLLKIVLGEMSDILLDSIRAEPAVLLKSGFTYNYTKIEQAFQRELSV